MESIETLKREQRMEKLRTVVTVLIWALVLFAIIETFFGKYQDATFQVLLAIFLILTDKPGAR